MNKFNQSQHHPSQTLLTISTQSTSSTQQENEYQNLRLSSRKRRIPNLKDYVLYNEMGSNET